MSISAAEAEIWSRDVPPTAPVSAPGTRCGAEMTQGGTMSFRCQLGQGHEARDEPHYAAEVYRSVEAWKAWAKDYWEKVKDLAPQPHVATAKGSAPSSPYCNLEGCDIGFRHTHGTDISPEYGQETVVSEPEVLTVPSVQFEPKIQAEKGPEDGPVLQLPEIPKRPTKGQIVEKMEEALAVAPLQIRDLYLSNESDVQAGQIHWPFDPECEASATMNVFLPSQRCFVCRPVNYVSLDESYDEPVRSSMGDQDDDPDVAQQEMAQALRGPTRTRKGDQVLPTGDESLEDDQSLLIADIEARREVGIERYGQGHRPFNGRNTVQDWYEEQLDGLVYARSILRMAEASREELVEVMKASLTRSRLQTPQVQAEQAVDSIMGWVVGQGL